MPGSGTGRFFPAGEHGLCCGGDADALTRSRTVHAQSRGKRSGEHPPNGHYPRAGAGGGNRGNPLQLLPAGRLWPQRELSPGDGHARLKEGETMYLKRLRRKRAGAFRVNVKKSTLLRA